MPRIIALSDTHNRHRGIQVPDGDILIHAGDATTHSTLSEMVEFCNWMEGLPHQYKFYIPGNHDRSVDYFFDNIKHLFAAAGVEVLHNKTVEVKDLRIHGLSWISPETVKKVPHGLDILVTHYPAMGILDEIPAHSKFNPTPILEHAGNPVVLTAVQEKKPRYFLSGHIHEGYGYEKMRDTHCYNCSQLNEHYTLCNKPWILDINPKS